jgi:hypothetical protein
MRFVPPDGPTARGAATSWRVYLVLQRWSLLVLPLVGREMISRFHADFQAR